MFCPNCGKEINNDVAFCPHCGKPQNKGNTTSVSGSGNVIPCPHCGSTDIVKRTNPTGLLLAAVVSVIVGIIFFIIRSQPGSTGWWTLLAIGFILFGGFNFLLAFAGFKNWNNTKWNMRCNTCNKEFSIDPPDGSKVITNIKSE